MSVQSSESCLCHLGSGGSHLVSSDSPSGRVHDLRTITNRLDHLRMRVFDLHDLVDSDNDTGERVVDEGTDSAGDSQAANGAACQLCADRGGFRQGCQARWGGSRRDYPSTPPVLGHDRETYMFTILRVSNARLRATHRSSSAGFWVILSMVAGGWRSVKIES